MYISDPIFWGSAAICVTIYLCAQDIVRQMRSDRFEANSRHHKVIEALDSIEREIKDLSYDIGQLEASMRRSHGLSDYD